jgi:hypothetical protein
MYIQSSAQIFEKTSLIDFCAGLKEAHFDVFELKAIGFPVSTLKTCGFDAASFLLMHRTVFAAENREKSLWGKKLGCLGLWNNFSRQELSAGGFSEEQIQVLSCIRSANSMFTNCSTYLTPCDTRFAV